MSGSGYPSQSPGVNVLEIVESFRESNREQQEHMNRLVEQNQRQNQQIVTTLTSLVNRVTDTKIVELSDASMEKLSEKVAEKIQLNIGAGWVSSSSSGGLPAPESSMNLSSNSIMVKSMKEEEERKWKEEEERFRQKAKDVVFTLILESESKHDWKKTLNMLYLIFDNMRKKPQEEKYRKVNTSSGRFKERFGNKPSHADIFVLLGFEKQSSNFVYNFT